MLDEKRRIVLPREVVEELDLAEGTAVAFEKKNGVVVIKKAKRKEDSLKELMEWNPVRTRKPRPIIEREVKEVWG